MQPCQDLVPRDQTLLSCSRVGRDEPTMTQTLTLTLTLVLSPV